MIGRQCAVEGCIRPAGQYSALCSPHADMRRNGRPLRHLGRGRKPGGRTCTVDGCTEPHYAHDVCRRHYDEQRAEARRI